MRETRIYETDEFDMDALITKTELEIEETATLIKTMKVNPANFSEEDYLDASWEGCGTVEIETSDQKFKVYVQYEPVQYETWNGMTKTQRLTATAYDVTNYPTKTYCLGDMTLNTFEKTKDGYAKVIDRIKEHLASMEVTRRAKEKQEPKPEKPEDKREKQTEEGLLSVIQINMNHLSEQTENLLWIYLSEKPVPKEFPEFYPLGEDMFIIKVPESTDNIPNITLDIKLCVEKAMTYRADFICFTKTGKTYNDLPLWRNKND